MTSKSKPHSPQLASVPTETPELVVPERSARALLMSLCFHVVLLVLLGFIIAKAPSGTGDDPDRIVGIALAHSLPDRTRYEDVADRPKNQDSVESDSTPSESSAAAAPADLTPPIDLDGILNAMEAQPDMVSGTGLAGDTKIGTSELGSTGAAKRVSEGEPTTTTVFGVSGSGSRFVYVFDRSDSMNGYGGRPLKVAKRELVRSLRTLTDGQRFQIIFYNDQPKPFQVPGLPMGLFVGETGLLSRAETYVNSVAAFGGTEHESALLLALRMSPDVIFFLTDARIPRLSERELSGIRRRAETAGTTIHTIEFGAEAVASPGSFLRDLAQQNHGQYQYVDVGKLRGPE